MTPRTIAILLALLASISCGDAHYRLHGRVRPGVSRVALLDTAALQRVQVMRDLHEAALDELRQRSGAKINSLEQAANEADAPLRAARDRLSRSEREYRSAFSGITRFESFGGNPIFSDADRSVRTPVLLEEIADRFYKGKAFSLETGREVRSYIRETLAPLERRVDQAKRLVQRRSADRKADHAAIQAAGEKTARERAALKERYDERIRDVLYGAQRLLAEVDSTGSYEFVRVESGNHHLYLAEPEPRIYAVVLGAHTRRDLLAGQGASPLLQAVSTEATE